MKKIVRVATLIMVSMIFGSLLTIAGLIAIAQTVL